MWQLKVPGRDSDKIWQAFHRALWSRPIQIEFRGWKGFASRMPRYVRRIRACVRTQEKYGGDGFLATFE